MAVSWDSNSISTLFSSLPSSGTGFFGTGSSSSTNMLSDLYSIRNGSYGKLMKAYYSQNSTSTSGTSDTDTEDTTDAVSSYTSSQATIANNVKSAANSLSSAANALIDSDLYSKVATTDADGNETEAVDVDSVYDAVSDFVSAYNKTLTAGAKSSSSTVQSSISSMTSYTKVNSNALAELGITIGSDNKLSIDEETFKNADMDDVQELFGQKGSYSYQISALATSVSSAASFSNITGYTSAGTYSSASLSSFFDSV
ncbi:MAG: hypothetical protein K5644_02925 [Lachnospiraceae bacterium]|nr:hypothetical protein [Lachnospiraceae bacterium]